MDSAGGDELKAAAEATYAASADHIDNPALGFWDRYGRRTVERLRLSPGATVLDACCGTGASALPAAQIVGPAGRVLGVDIAEPALDLARRKASVLGLANVTFTRGDIEHLDVPPADFDAVVCVFGVFFLPDMVATVRTLYELVRPGGQLAITVWGPDWFEPGTSAFWESVGRERPDLVHGFEPWTRITDPGAIRQLLVEAGVDESTVDSEPGWHPLPAPDDWWTAVMGSGLRGTVEQLSPDSRERVRAANLDWARQHGLAEIQTNVIYARSTRPLS